MKLRSIFFLSFFLIFTSLASHAQLSDIARVDYTIIPNDPSDIEFTRARALFNFPIKLKKEGTYLLLGLDYSNIQLSIQKENVPFIKEELNDFQILDLAIGYTQPLGGQWRLGIRFKPGFSTNLTAKSLSADDIVFSGDLVFIKEKLLAENRKSRLILGISYAGNRGFPFPLPFISYYRKFRQDWSFNLGIPKSNLQYHISARHRLKAYAELDGFTANIQGGVLVDNIEANSINLSLLVSGLQYEYHFWKRFQAYARTAYVLSNRTKLRKKNRDNIFTLDNERGTYIRFGVRIKI